MSSAEDKTSSTVLSSKASSNSAPEEFPVNPHQEDRNEHGSSAPLPKGPNQIELSASNSPEQAPAEPGEDAGTPLKTKPLPKVSAIAREVRVKVTGARVISGERELFTESTTTVLVLEKGAVIRLTGAVTPGQLLFLTNEESQREVVTQVTRKRDHRPTECYVELEFTEPAPGFWGMEFSAATALLPKDAQVIAAAEMIASAETTDDELDEAALRPSAEEVEALKREVDALRSQLTMLQTQAQAGQAESATIPNVPAVSPASTSIPQTETPGYQTEKVPWAELTSPAFPIEGQPKSDRMTGADQQLLPKRPLYFHVPLPKRKRSFRARGQFTPGFRTGMLRLAILSTVLAALIGTAWYKHLLPWMHESTKFSVEAEGGVTTAAPLPDSHNTAPVSVEVKNVKPEPAKDAPVSVKAEPQNAAPTGGPPEKISPAKRHTSSPAVPIEVQGKPIARSKFSATTPLGKSSPSYSPATTSSGAVRLAAESSIVPPKLIKSERAVASLDDLRDFETGSVVIDAIIDPAGNVNSMNVLSGPPSLRRPALQALRYYKYEPAMQNGSPVAAHVTVKIQFHFE